MKTYAMILIAISAATISALAQPDIESPPDRPPPFERGGRGNGVPPIHRALQELKRAQPEEFARLEHLRVTDPAAFRQAMREHLQVMFVQKLEHERPSVHAALAALPEADRAWVMERLARPPGGPPIHRSLPPLEAPETHDVREASRELIRQYRQSDSDDERQRIRAALREQLSRQYDARLQERQNQLREAEATIQSIRAAIDQGALEKDSFIDKKLNQWLGPR